MKVVGYWPSERSAMRLKIERSDQAQNDQTDIWLTIAEDNMRAADGVYERINDTILMLAEHPEAGRARDDLRHGLRYFPSAVT